jgi:2'-5' RNA ligase
MRLFVAVPLADVVKDELSAISARLKSGSDSMRWSSAESWHLTLQFLGKTGADQFACVVARLRAVRAEAVPVALEGLGCFDRAAVLFAGVRLTPELITLQQHVTAATAECGFAAEERAYHPHITLARTGRGDRRGGLSDLKTKMPVEPRFTQFVAPEFLLYESFLGPGGSRYEVCERFALRG